MEIIEAVDQASNISPVPELIRVQVMFEGGAIDIVIRWVTVDKSVEEKCVERKPPVRR